MKYRYFPGPRLMTLNEQAKKEGKRCLPANVEKNIKLDLVYPIVRSMCHNDVEIRCEVIVNPQGQVCILDIPIAEHNKLPETDA
jgi:hypothetical protein